MAQPTHKLHLALARLVDPSGDGAPVPGAGRQAAGPQQRVRTRVVRRVVVLEVAERLSDVVEDLDRAIQMALADGPRGVVCDLTALPEDAEPDAIKVLAAAGRHVRDWPATPIAVASPDPRVRAALSAHPLAGHLIVTASMLSALYAVLAIPAPAVRWLRLAPHPTAPRASRDFVTRNLLDWRLGRVIPSASLVVSELVTNSAMYAGTDIELSVVWNLGALRLTVRDNSPSLPRQRPSSLDLHGRGLTIVAGLSRAFGFLPTAVGGKVVWAVLDAPRPGLSASRSRSAPATKESPVFTVPARIPPPVLPAPLKGHHAFAQRGAADHSTLATTERPARAHAVAPLGTAQASRPNLYNDPSNYLG